MSASLCRSCGYDLGGLSREDNCPECGAPVRRSRYWDQPPDVIVDDHLLCMTCGYDLIGLKTRDQCPECAAPIRPSIVNSLRVQPISVLKRLRSGPIWIFAAMVAQFVFGFGSMFMIGAAVGMSGSMTLAGLALGSVGALLALAIQVTGLIGNWKLTTPLAGPKPEVWKRGGHRLTIRVTSVIVLVASVLVIPAQFLAAAFFAPTGGMSGFNTQTAVAFGITTTLGIIAGLAQLVRFLSTAAYVNALATRMPDPRLARFSLRLYRWMLATILIGIATFAIVMGGAMLLAAGQSSGPAMGFFILPYLAVLVIAIVAFALWISWIVMLAQFLAKISKTLNAARRSLLPDAETRP